MKHPAALAALARLAPPRPATDLLFVRRTSTTKRVLQNLDQVEAAAQRLGFRIIEPGRMTLAEQIKAFAGARVVAGVSGADLANIVFMPEGGDVICMLPPRGREFFFWDICCIRKPRYWSIFGPPLTGRSGGHDDFAMDADMAARAMAQAAGVGT
jgi:capsular polysaccharide biosynthesis protein